MNYVGGDENNESPARGCGVIWASAPATLTLEPDDECLTRTARR